MVDDCPVYACGLAAILHSAGFAVNRVPPADFPSAVPRTAGVVLLGRTAVPDLLVLYTRSGAAARVSRDAEVDTLVTAVRSVAGTGRVVPSARGSLSPRELEVLGHIARGLTHGRTAELMGISPHTVDTYVKRIRAKLNLGNKAELACAAVGAR